MASSCDSGCIPRRELRLVSQGFQGMMFRYDLVVVVEGTSVSVRRWLSRFSPRVSR